MKLLLATLLIAALSQTSSASDECELDYCDRIKDLEKEVEDLKCIVKGTCTTTSTYTEDYTTGSSVNLTTPSTRTTSRILNEIDFTCALVYYGFIPHKTKCSSYYECIRGIQYLRECSAGQIFDIDTTACGDPETSICAIAP